MARMIPRDLVDFNNSYGERVVFESLKKLPDEYSVFHSVVWNRRNERGRITWGESDFTVLHPNKGIIVIEVKSGGIEYNNGHWNQIRTDTGLSIEIGCPLNQAGRSKYHFIELLNKGLTEGNYCLVEQAVWFPSVSSRDVIGSPPMQYAKDIVLLENALKQPKQYIDQIYEYYDSQRHTHLDPANYERIIEIFAPCFQVVSSMSYKKSEADNSFLRLTNEQSILLDYLEEQRVATIQGNAGTGKTMLAVEKAKRIAASGSVLFLCYNKFLYEFLSSTFPNKNIEYVNLFSLVCRKMGIPNVDSKGIQEFLDHYDNYNWDYKHIIIDEGQDFESQEIELLQQIADINQGCFYVFFDKYQLIQRNNIPSWLNSAECRLVLNRNCRNTHNIAITSGKPISFVPKMPFNSILGDMPRFFMASDQSSLLGKIEELITKYVKGGFKLEEICILTLKTEALSNLSGILKVGKYSIANKRIEGAVLFTTVRKFKGLESDIVMLIDVDRSVFDDEVSRRVFYVGASRAKHHLDILFMGNEDQLSELSDSIDAKNRGGKALKGIALGLNIKPLI